jgi:hypothetical protein
MENRVEGRDDNSKKVAFKTGLFLLVLNLFVSAATVCVYDRYFAQKVVAFDIRGYMADQKKLFYAGKITEEELLKSLDRLDDFLRFESGNTLILNGDAVIKNAKFIKP